MEFDWTQRTVAEWRELIAKSPRANWLQSLPFARAVRVRDQKVTRLATIKLEGKSIGMMAIQEIKLGWIHVLYLYRGPLWFTSNPPEEWLASFADLFAKTFPRRILRLRRWLPEWRDGNRAKEILGQFGFKSKQRSFETIWLDLREPEEKLRAQLKQKWRNALNKGQSSKLKTRIDDKGSSTELFLAQYDRDLKQKKYRGRSPAFIREEIKTALYFKEVAILWALSGDEPVAAILVILHGQSATYRVGWTTPQGRQSNAHNVLLWEAVKTLKTRGISYFDLGGVEPHGAEGLTHFKQGLGGEEFKLVGVFS